MVCVQTGLSGSSAIVWAALKCLLEYFDIPTKQAQVDGLPSLILRVEEELGITAGLQDRVVQVYGGLVYMVRFCLSICLRDLPLLAFLFTQSSGDSKVCGRKVR